MIRYKIIGTFFRLFVYGFLLLPLFIVVCTSVSDTAHIVFPPQGFTLRWFAEALANRQFMRSVGVSLRVAAISTCVSTVIGTMISLYFWKVRGYVREFVEIAFLSPVVVPTVVSAVAFLQFYSRTGAFVNNFTALALSHAVIQIAYVIRTETATLYSMDAEFEEASLVLGASPLRTLFKVTLPCAKRGIIAGAIFAFVVSFDEAVIVMFLADARTITYPLRLYSYISEHFNPMVSAFSTIFIFISFVVIVTVEKTIGLNKVH